MDSHPTPNERVRSDIQRILQAWFRGVVPGEVLRLVLPSWGIVVARVPLTHGLSGYSKDLNSIYLHDNIQERLTYQTAHLNELESQLICKEWVKLRIHTSKGRPPGDGDEDFITSWVEEFFLPEEQFQESEEYQAIQQWSVHGYRVSHRQLWPLIKDLAKDFHCTPSFVCRALKDRGFIDTAPLRLICSRPDNVIALPGA